MPRTLVTWYEVTWVFLERETSHSWGRINSKLWFEWSLWHHLWCFYDRRVSASGDFRYACEVVWFTGTLAPLETAQRARTSALAAGRCYDPSASGASFSSLPLYRTCYQILDCLRSAPYPTIPVSFYHSGPLRLCAHCAFSLLTQMSTFPGLYLLSGWQASHISLLPPQKPLD